MYQKTGGGSLPGGRTHPGGFLLSGARPQNAHISLLRPVSAGKGDITSPSVSYDGPRYACLNEGEVYDRLIGEDDFGRFANSFLIIASKDGRQEKTIFAKYNRTRKEEFRIRTTMGDLDGERRVEKAALEKRRKIPHPFPEK